jgi:hypothetical protein
LHSFSYIPGGRRAGDALPPVEHVRSVVFALNSDLTEGGKTEVARYKEVCHDQPPYIGAICVAGREYWWEQNGGWICHEAMEDFDEVLGFIAGVTNTYRFVAESRGYPPLGLYIASESSAGLRIIATGKSVTVRFGPDGIKVGAPHPAGNECAHSE